MVPRLNEIHTRALVQQTPAPLLTTRKGQYPNLPYQLAKSSTPPSTTPLLHIPLSDWHTLNPNTNLTAADLLPSLKGLPHAGTSLSSYIANPDAITFLAPRGPSSTAFITSTPGKSLSLTATQHSYTLTTTPEKVARLYEALDTDFVIAPTDHPPLCDTPSPTQLRRRVERVAKLREAFLTTGAGQVITSIGGGDSAELRRASARDAVKTGVVGYSVDGLYTGESPSTREECLRAAMDVLPEEGLRLLSGGSGAPWEVLMAVRAGVDVIEADYPFETAASGYATDLRKGGVVNLRDRGLETCKDVLVKGCQCLVCREGFSKGYLRHLFEVHEIMAVSFVTAHNLWDYFCWFERLRDAVEKQAFESFVDEFERCREAVRVGKG